MVKKIIIGIVILLVVIQLFGPEKTNPPVEADLIAGVSVKTI